MSAKGLINGSFPGFGTVWSKNCVSPAPSPVALALQNSHSRGRLCHKSLSSVQTAPPPIPAHSGSKTDPRSLRPASEFPDFHQQVRCFGPHFPERKALDMRPTPAALNSHEVGHPLLAPARLTPKRLLDPFSFPARRNSYAFAVV